MKCFLAAHGTGKSTLLKEIHKIRPDIFTTEGFARPIKKAFKRFDNVNQLELEQVMNFELMLTAQRNYYDQNVLTTRSLFDSQIFIELFGCNFLSLAEEIREEMYESKDKIKDIFYLPIEFPLDRDGVRYGEVLQKQFDLHIHKLIDKLDLYDKVHIIKGSVEERLNQIIPILAQV